jgi:hypothetical protein
MYFNVDFRKGRSRIALDVPINDDQTTRKGRYLFFYKSICHVHLSTKYISVHLPLRQTSSICIWKFSYSLTLSFSFQTPLLIIYWLKYFIHVVLWPFGVLHCWRVCQLVFKNWLFRRNSRYICRHCPRVNFDSKIIHGDMATIQYKSMMPFGVNCTRCPYPIYT